MKARDFEYRKAENVAQAIDLLSRHDGTAKLLAGGQSLLAGLNLRLSAPELVIDITGLEELRGISLQDNIVRIGALTRHVEILRSEIVRNHLPLISEAIKSVGHVGIRNRGTIGGSIAYADPSAEMPACAITLEAVIVVEGPKGRRRIDAADFFDGLFSTVMQPDEIIIEFLYPVQKSRSSWAFLELSRRHGDFAMAGIAMVVTPGADGIVETSRVVYFGCTDYPALAAATAEAMSGASISDPPLAAVQAAMENELQLEDTPGYRADTKLRLARAITRRALARLRASRPALDVPDKIYQAGMNTNESER